MWTSLPNFSGPFPESQVSLHLLFSDITMSPHIHRTGLMSGLAVLSLLIIILSVVLFLLCKKEGRIFSRGKCRNVPSFFLGLKSVIQGGVEMSFVPGT